MIAGPWQVCYDLIHGKPESQGGLPSLTGGADPPDERKEGLPMYVTYSDLIQVGIFIVAPCRPLLHGLQGKKIAATTANSDGRCCKALF